MTKRITGKQFANNTINTNHLNLSTPVNSYDATRKDYVDYNINENISIERESKENINMLANTGSTNTYLACNKSIIDDPIYNTIVDVFLNGLKINVGDGYECYFSPDGIIIRELNDVRISDKLYWNYTNASYHLELDDIFDFKYLTNDSQIKTIELEIYGETVVTSDDRNLVLKFSGILNQYSTLVITGVSFRVGLTTSGFTFDMNDTNGYLHVFTYIGEIYELSISGLSYSINWDGEGSILFSVITKNDSTQLYGHKTIINYNYNDYYYYSANGNNTRLATLKNWLFLILTVRNGVGWYDAKLFIYKKVNEEWVKTQELYNDNNFYPLIVTADKSGLNKFILKRFKNAGSLESAQIYVLNGETWEKEADLMVTDNIGSMDMNGNNSIIGDRTMNFDSGNTGIVWTFHYSGETWWGPTIIDAPSWGNKFGYSTRVYGNHLSTISSIDNKIHTYTTSDSGVTWGNHQEITGHTQTSIGIFYEYIGAHILNKEMIAITDNEKIVMWEYIGDLISGTWIEVNLNLSELPPSGDYFIETFSFVDENIIYVPIIVLRDYLYRDEAKTNYYQKINDTWELTVLKTPYPQNRHGGYGWHHTDGSGGTYFNAWYDYNETLSDLDYYTIITECGKLSSSNNILPRNVRPSAAGLLLNTGTTTIDLTYDYSHKYGYTEKNSLIKWYSYDNWVTGSTQITNYNDKNAKIDSTTNGKLINVTVNAKDENGVQDIYQSSSNKLWVYNDDNEAFNTTSLDSAVVILTIISGSIGSTSAGIYNISANTTFSQSSTSTIWFFNTTNMSMNLNGHPSYGAIILNINGGEYSNTLTGSYNGVPTDLFTQYIIGGVTFTIGKGPGWKFYN